MVRLVVLDVFVCKTCFTRTYVVRESIIHKLIKVKRKKTSTMMKNLINRRRPSTLNQKGCLLGNGTFYLHV